MPSTPNNNRDTHRRVTSADTHRQRCADCFRPFDLCYCDAITEIATRTEFLILQHRKERMHPFNSARIAARALTNATLVCDRNDQLAKMNLPIKPSAGLLYPAKDARLLNEVPANELPDQIIVIDGTWHHAKTIYRDLPALHQLPCFVLAPETPGQYRIRLEPDATSLSTIEAIAATVKQMEPDNQAIDRLLDGFNEMIEKQMSHPNACYSGQTVQSTKASNLNIPKHFKFDSKDEAQERSLVVVYAEATPLYLNASDEWASLKEKRRHCRLPPAYVCAQRIHLRPDGVPTEATSTAEDHFMQLIQPQTPPTEKDLGHMELDLDDFDKAVPSEQFCARWNDFLRPTDRLVTHHRSSITLLQNIGATVLEHDVLNSINYDPQRQFNDVAEYLKSVGQLIGEPICKGRSGRRLAAAVALVQHFCHCASKE